MFLIYVIFKKTEHF